MSPKQDEIPEPFKNIETTDGGLDYYSLSYFAYFKLLDKGVLTYKNKISRDVFLEYCDEHDIDISHDDYRNMCSTIKGSDDNPSLFGIYKNHDGEKHKVDLLRAEKKKLDNDEEPKFYLWIQFGDQIRGFTEDGDYADVFSIDHNDHVQWVEENEYGEFMSRVISDKSLSKYMKGELYALRDRHGLMEYVSTQRMRILNTGD